jgi:hypothetical protein
MRPLILSAVLLAGASFPAPSAAAPLTPAAQRDLRCFMLYAMAVDQAVNKKDEKMQQAAGLGLIYFLGKLKVEAPALVLADAIRQEAGSLKDDEATRSAGDSCDREFQSAGAEMRNLGPELTGKNDTAPSK